MEFKSKPMREIHIRATANGGFIVSVGCATFAYTVEENMISDLGDYIRDPKEVEKEYNKHHKHEEDCAPERPRSLGTMDQVFREQPETEGQAEAQSLDPAENMESSGY